MADVTYPQILKYGLQAGYEAITTKDPNVLYFCTDTGKIYKGTVDFSNSVIVAASKPTTPIVGKLYVLADTGTCEIYTGSAWKVVSYPAATTIDATSDDLHVATAKAVWDAIQDAVADVVGAASTVKAVEAGTEAGKVKVTKGDNTSQEFTIPGVVTKPTWDANARKLTIPVTGDTAVEVNIGKDIFLDTTAANGYNDTTKTIDLYLNDGSGEEKPATKISIPAADLIDVYTGENANGVTTTVSADNKIKVELVLDPDEKNALTLTAAGLKLDLSAYAKTSEVTALTDALQTAVEAAQAKADANEGALEILNGAATVEGSVDYKVAAAKTAMETALGTTNDNVTALTARVSTNETDIAANTEKINALVTATTTWGTF